MNRGFEIEPSVSTRADELKDRQDQFAVLLVLNPEQLRGLKFCGHCGGEDYEWTDWSLTDIHPGALELDTPDGEEVDIQKYRSYLANIVCKHCDGTGFEGGSFSLGDDEWYRLGSHGF